MESTELTRDRIRCYLELALAIARKDKPKAWKLIDRSFDLMTKDPQKFSSYSALGQAAGAALSVAYIARVIDYPDVESLVAQALELRAKMSDYGTEDRAINSLAFALAMVDPAAGIWLLRARKTDAELIADSTNSQREVLFTMMLSDPPLCLRACQAAIGKTPNTGTLAWSGIVELTSAMTYAGKEFDALRTWANVMYQPLVDTR